MHLRVIAYVLAVPIIIVSFPYVFSREWRREWRKSREPSVSFLDWASVPQRTLNGGPMLRAVRRLLRAYMAYWDTPDMRTIRRRYVLTMTPTMAIFGVICAWYHEWAIVAICVVVTVFGIWRFRRLRS